MILFHIHDDGSSPPARRSLRGGWTAVAIGLDQVGSAPIPLRDCIVDIDLKNAETVRKAKTLLPPPAKSAIRIFVCRRDDRQSTVQAGVLGATHLVERPATDGTLNAVLARITPDGRDPQPVSAVVSALALGQAFQSLVDGTSLDSRTLGGAAAEVAAGMATTGVSPWLQSIYSHHVGTYQHCLLVTGFATAFGQLLGLPETDLSDLTLAAILHDIGKAKISLAILDKPGRLDPDEFAVIRQHPVWGDEYLQAHSDVAPTIRAAVRDHHECLDGSGYPNGITGREIGDLTRLITIADVFSALVEARAYKPPMPADRALGILRELAASGKVESALVEAFAPIAGRVQAEGAMPP